MTTNPANELAALRRSIEVSLRAYGQDFAMRGAAPGEQRWGDPVLALAVAGVALWAVRVAAEAAIKEIVARRVARKAKSRELEELLKRVEALETRFDELANGQIAVRDGIEVLDRGVAEALAELRAHVEDLRHTDMEAASLQAVFVKLGLTQRRAKSAASDVGPRLLQFLMRESRQ
jgi:cell division protein FtsB